MRYMLHKVGQIKISDIKTHLVCPQSQFAQYVADEHGGEQFEQLAVILEDDQETEDIGDENDEAIAEPALADD